MATSGRSNARLMKLSLACLAVGEVIGFVVWYSTKTNRAMMRQYKDDVEAIDDPQKWLNDGKGD